MAYVEKITNKLSRLDEFLSILQGMQGISLDAFLNDKYFPCTMCRVP